MTLGSDSNGGRISVGLPGLGKDDTARTVDAVEQTKGALELAREEKSDPGPLGGAATRMIENLLDIGIDGKGPFDSAQRVADVARAKRADAEQAVDAIVRSHLKLGAAGGFITSMGGFITMPISLPANVLEFYVLATRMVASIASVRGYDIKQPEIRSAVLLTLIDAEADDLLRKAGVVKTGRMSDIAIQRLPGPVLLVVNKAVAFRLLSTAGRKTFSRLGKGVPVVGGVVGAGLDTYLLKRIADNARHEFPPRSRAV